VIVLVMIPADWEFHFLVSLYVPIVVKVRAVPDPVVAEQPANLLCLVVFGYIRRQHKQAIYPETS